MFKYGRNAKKMSSRLHGSRGACLSSTLLGVEVIVGLGFFLHLVHSEDSKDSDSCSTGLGLLCRSLVG